MNQHYLQLYADFIVKVGVNVQPRQNFIIRCPVTMPEFGHACVKAGYEAGAKNCIVRWEDDKLSRLHYEYAKEEDLAAMKPYELRSYLDYAEDPDGCCTLAIHAADPEALAGLDAAKINRVNLARRKFLKPWQEYTMNDRVQWCVAAVPAPSWAAKVFPGIPVEEAMEKLWALIFDVCRVSTGDPVSAWKAHVAEGRRHRDQLNAWNLDHIHMTSSNGTDLTVGLADDATWEGASSKAENGTDFIANVPTEEVFCAPHRERVNGLVYGTKPYVYNGQLIEGWHVTFKDGKVVGCVGRRRFAVIILCFLCYGCGTCFAVSECPFTVGEDGHFFAVLGGADDVGIRRADHDILMDSGIVQALGQQLGAVHLAAALDVGGIASAKGNVAGSVFIKP